MLDGCTRILIVDDQPLIRMGIRTIIESTDGMKVIAEASTGVEAVALAKQHQPDVVLLDVSLQETCGLQLIDPVRDVAEDVRFVVLTESADLRIIRNAYPLCVRSFCAKNASPTEIVAAVRAATADRCYTDASSTADMIELLCRVPEDALQRTDSRFEKLSAREREVFSMLTRGMTNKEIGSALGISHKTAETHHMRVLRKLGICDSVELLRYAVRLGFIDVANWASE